MKHQFKMKFYICKVCGIRKKAWIESACFKLKLCPKHLDHVDKAGSDPDKKQEKDEINADEMAEREEEEKGGS